MFNRTIEILLCENGGRNGFNFFKDNTLELEAKVVYDAARPDEITKMILSGKNLNQNVFDIKHVTHCQTDGLNWGERFLIHIDNTNTPDGLINFEIDRNYDQNLLKSLDFSKSSVSLFFFKEYASAVPTGSTKLDCKMQMGTPKTKDGAIVVGG